MKKYVVISSDNNDSYLFLTSIITWAWNKLGWNVIVIIPAHSNKTSLIEKYITDLGGENKISYLPDLTGYIDRTETVAQCCRLYASGIIDGLIMTSDADMLPLSDYWHPQENEITAYGRNLSDRHYVMCYIAMDDKKWKDTLDIEWNMENSLIKDFSKREDVNSDNWEEWWQSDQNFITEKLNNARVVNIDRPINSETGYPVGRVDRSAWDKSLLQKERIDAHLFRKGYEDENWNKILTLIVECFQPTFDDLLKLNNYRNEYVKIL